MSLYCATYLSTNLCALSLILFKCSPCHPTTWCAVCYCCSASKMQRNLMKLLLLLVIFFYFSSLFSASAFPVTITQNLKGHEEEEFSAVPSLTRLDHVLGNDMKEGEVTERRVYLETQDYEGTGANRDHDPKSPGGV